MLRDFKFMRRTNSGKTQDLEEIENVPINPNLDNDVSGKSKFERTPVKSKIKNPDTPAFRTPERQGLRKRFGFSGANEGGKDEGGKSEMSSHLNQTSRNGGSTLNLTPRVSGVPNGKTTTMTTTTSTYSGYSESTSTQNTPTKSVSKPPNPGYAPWSTSRHPGNGSVARVGGSYGMLARGFSNSGAQNCVLNTIEVPHFDLKEDASFWMHHNVQVILRVRPLNNVEKSTQGYHRCVKQDSAQSITWIGQPETRFTFDHVACETVDQEMLFRMAGRPIVENCLSGYNSCMFAYGQTGSGKTYTMLGDMEDVEYKPSSHRGMAPRIFEFLFARINSEEELRSDEKLKYSCRCSFLEIYNEQITDLLDPSSTNLLLREDVKNGVYVENLSEFEVHTVGDVLRLLIQGSSNRRVAATNMNRESSRSHSVFTCIITSKWERDSTSNQRFARLNLVDLAGSERQKSSGAEGERLKEAANINKSLSTLGHVIMLLVDIAHGKPKHVPYRDSRLTFLLQDSLGGNSKTMIIANISPSVCCAAETLNTLKFAQRAKMIQNNAVVNEDSSGDVTVLQHQILLLKEELSALKRQKNPSRILEFDSSCTARGDENVDMESPKETDQTKAANLLGSESKGNMQLSSKQFKSLELMLAGALRREQMAESTIKKLEAEIEQLNRLVRQREEDTRSTKMQLKFREDKIQRMESLLGGLKPVDTYLLEENSALCEEIQLLQAKADRNPEVTRFAIENIRLLEQLRRFQDFYEEGERDILLQEISELRSQLICSIDTNSHQHKNAEIVQDAANNSKENESIHSELTCTLTELAECQRKLQSCLETNAKLNRDIEDLQAQLRNKESGFNALKEMQAPSVEAQAIDDSRNKHRDVLRNAEEIVNLELELDILKIIMKEERVLHGKMEETTSSLKRDVQLAEERVMLMRKQWEDAKSDLNEAKSVIEALEAQQLLSINEIEDLKIQNNLYKELLHQQEIQRHGQESTFSSLKRSEVRDSPLQLKLKKMQASLDKAKQMNMLFQSNHATQRSNEEEMDEIRRQAEAETAEVIVCLQEELSILQQRVEESESRETEAQSKLLEFEIKFNELQETSNMMSLENEGLRQSLLEKNMEIKSMVEDWELLCCEIEESLRNASDQLDLIPLSDRRTFVSEQFGKIMRNISNKESVIEELNHCLENANTRANEMEYMLMSLRGAFMAMRESHEQVCNEKERELKELREELMAHLSNEEKMLMWQKMDCESKGIFESGVLSLQVAFTDFFSTCESKILDLDNKLHLVEGCAREVKYSWNQKKELFESQLVGTKEDISLCGKKQSEGEEIVKAGVFGLQAAFTDFQNKCESKILALDHKLCKVEDRAQEAKSSWCQTKGILEWQLNATTTQNAIEASHLMTQFEEAQNMMKDADIMINGLMIANETLKLQVEDLRNSNIVLTSERNNLLNECQDLEKQLELEVSQNLTLFEELKSVVSQLQEASEEGFVSLTHDLTNIKSEIHGNFKTMNSSFEDIWSQIFMKDCALSVLHLCQMGVFLEAVTSLNAENGLLRHGIRESNEAISDLRARNVKSNEELDMCRLLKGKLLTDFKSSLDRVLSKEGEAKELNCKLDRFSEKLLVLQHQEELMLDRCNFMNTELSSLMEELSQSNSQMMSSLEEQEENFTVEWYAKDLELLMLTSNLQDLVHYRDNIEGQRKDFRVVMDYLMSEIVILQINKELKEHIEVERVDEAQDELAKVLTQLQIFEKENTGLKERLKMKNSDLENIQNGMFLLQTSSSDLQNKLLNMESEHELLQNKLLDLKRENSVMLEDIKGLREESVRKEEVINGLMFDLRLSQELAANNKDQKDKLEELEAILDSRENDLEIKAHELDEALAYGRVLEEKVTSQEETLSKLVMDLEKSHHSVNILSDENSMLRSELESIAEVRSFLERELSEQKSINDGLENELLEMGNTLSQVNDLVESLKTNLDKVKNEKDQLEKELSILEGKVETAHALAEENEAIAAEAQEIAESRRVYAEEKEEEVLLLERSVQELDSTISVLENKVDVLKGDAEKQRLQREELELELQALKTQMLNVESADADIKRNFDEKSRKLQEALKRIQVLEKDLKNKDTEISKCKSHISELTLHAEAQGITYKQKFKELEAMIEQLKSEEVSNHEKVSSSNKLEKNTSKGRGSASPFKGKGSSSPFKPKGSGSPFKCIGLGLAHQFKSEKDEELTAERQRIEELEDLAASRQKEIFMLNAKLATAESMTHDVIRDLVGVKLDMSSYATLLDKQKAQKISEKAQLVGAELEEVNELKKQLNDFIEERKGWLSDINRKQDEVSSVQTALEKLHQEQQLLTSENEELKMEIENHKKKVTELEGELKKVSGQQNFHQRIHHHAKIKEENNVLKVQNEDLCHRLRRAESLLSRIKEELAHYRACNGKSPHVNFDEEQRLKNTLKETKQEKQYLAQTLLDLCSNILKACGITNPASEIDLSVAEEALQHLVAQITSLERELEDLRLKLKIANERVRLAELMPDTSPYNNTRSGDSRQTPRRASQSPFFSALDR